jgi:hypothetical protein
MRRRCQAHSDRWRVRRSPLALAARSCSCKSLLLRQLLFRYQGLRSGCAQPPDRFQAVGDLLRETMVKEQEDLRSPWVGNTEPDRLASPAATRLVAHRRGQVEATRSRRFPATGASPTSAAHHSRGKALKLTAGLVGRWTGGPVQRAGIVLSQTSPCPRACPNAVFGLSGPSFRTAQSRFQAGSSQRA